MPGGRPPVPIADRLWAKVDRGQDPAPCWLWPGSLSFYRYGILSENVDGRTKTKQAHIVSYESVNGAVPEGLHLDHTCHGADLSCPGGRDCLHRRCVNPSHLEAVTQAENNRRMQARKTHCPKGHPLAGDNLYVAPSSTHRECRTCRKANMDRFYQEKGLEYHRAWRAKRDAA